MPNTPPTPWAGRDDGDGPEHARWHKVVTSTTTHDGEPPAFASGGDQDAATGDDQPHVGLVGFRTDEGVRRNQGRVGAAEGPEALRRALAPMAAHGRLATGDMTIRDHGDAVTIGQDLEAGQAEAARVITEALDTPGVQLTVVLGGGHETAWSSYLGLLEAERMRADGDGRRPRWGVLNLDGHFDLRTEDRPTSGTPFLQMAEAEAAAGRELNYAVLGIAEPANTGALFDQARRLGVRWWTDLECIDAGAAGIKQFVADFAADLDVLYLTIDLDLLPAAVAPGVSAPAALGVPIPLVVAAVRAAAATGKLALMDVVELNPSLDLDGRTAKTAARLIDEAVRTVIGDGVGARERQAGGTGDKATA